MGHNAANNLFYCINLKTCQRLPDFSKVRVYRSYVLQMAKIYGLQRVVNLCRSDNWFYTLCHS